MQALTDSQTDSTAPMALLVDTLLQRHGGSINGMLFYGSCLRSGQLFDGLVDLYLIVDDYRSFYRNRFSALFNWILPPNVFYIQIPASDDTLRCKYTVISSADFQKGSTRWFETYIWGRFTQPASIVYSRDNDCRERLQRQLVQSSITFLNRVLPRLPETGTVDSLWQKGLELSYGVELRAESSTRAGELVKTDQDSYQQRLLSVARSLQFPVTINKDLGEMRYHAHVPLFHRVISRFSWPLRRVQGKLLSVLRLLKALFTFEGGLDYLAWKLERHSGQKVEIPDRVRRYPLIFVWGLIFRLYRRGVIR